MKTVIAAVALATVGSGAALAAVRPAVLPMDARVFVDPASRALAIQFSGRTPAGAAGDRVVMLVRDCMSRHFRQIGGTTTAAGGFWTVTGGGGGAGSGFPLAGSGSTYQARWKGRPTSPFTFRARLEPFIWKYNATQFGTWVALGYDDPLVPMGGRSVAVQRLTDNGWVTMRTLRLRAQDPRRFEARFTVSTPNLTIRVLASTRTARPCFNGGASDTVRTG